MKTSIRILITLLLVGLSLRAAAALNAWLDQDRVGPGETVQLTLQHNGQTSSQPDLAPLKQDFDMLGRSTGSSVQIINGRMSSTVQATLTLAPRHGGKLMVPPLQWDGQYTPALTLTVSGNGAAPPSASAPAGNASHLFITATPDTQQPYVQAAVPLTVRLYVDEPLYQASLDLQPGNDVLIQRLGKDSQTSVVRNGRTYRVIERKYLLFPQHSGQIRLDGPVLDAQVPDSRSTNPFGSDSFFGNVFGRNPFAGMVNTLRPIRIRGNPIVMNVRSRPAKWTGRDWLPAQNVTLQETWQPDRGPIRAGDPVTLHLHLSAVGLTAPQLPDLGSRVSLPQGLRAYPDQAKLNTGAQDNDVVGTRDQDIALIAGHAGRYVIPALHLSWWDTGTNSQREINLPAHTLEVVPGSATATTTPPSPNLPVVTLPSAPQTPATTSNALHLAQSKHWPWVSMAFALLWLATLFTWWLSSRRNAKRASRASAPTAAVPVVTQHAAAARNAFRQACRENNPQAARRRLLDWARAAWPDDPPLGLKALVGRVDDPEINPLLNELDRACYAGGNWQGDRLQERLKTLPKDHQPSAAPAAELAGLYP